MLVELAKQTPTPLRVYPNPRVAGTRRAPFHIRLAPWAESVASDLHRRFRHQLVLCLGCFAYPSGEWVDANWHVQARADGLEDPWHNKVRPADPMEVVADLTKDLFAPAGLDVTGKLVLTNRSDHDLELLVPPRRRNVVVDAATGRVVGGDLPGPNPDPPRRVALPARAMTTLPLRVGTASYHRSLGWAVPAGPWAVRSTLDLTDGRMLQLPLLPLVLT